MEKRKRLIVVVGPTAVGKTSLCINLAKSLGTEILSADSRQFYKEMNIGTAKPTSHELSQVQHHFINTLSISEAYNIVEFEKDALQKIAELFKKHDQVIMTGGSGLYIKIVCDGIDKIPDVNPEIRTSLNKIKEENGLEGLVEKLKKLDPIHANNVDLLNPQRVIRALEVCIGTGKPYSDFMINNKADRPFDIIKIGLELARKTLFERIDLRMDLMIKAALFEEAKSLYKYKSLNALQTVGYKEIFDYLDGKYDKEEAIRLLKRNSRRFAKRQMTWFKKEEEIKWFKPSDFDLILSYLNKN